MNSVFFLRLIVLVLGFVVIRDFEVWPVYGNLPNSNKSRSRRSSRFVYSDVSSDSDVESDGVEGADDREQALYKKLEELKKRKKQTDFIINQTHRLQRELALNKPKAEQDRFLNQSIRIAEEPVNCWFIRPWDGKNSYDVDDVNFTETPKNERLKSKRWVVLVNMHSNVPVIFGGAFPKGPSRSYAWAVPYGIAVKQFSDLGSVHSLSALPLDWSGGGYRQLVSFLLVPPGTPMEFKIGYAKEQVEKDFEKVKIEYDRSGFGVQMRLKYIPKGTIIITGRLVSKQQIKRAKEQKRIDIERSFKIALDKFNASAVRKESELPVLSKDMINEAFYDNIENFLEKCF